MRTLLDTSVLVAAMIEGHPAHARALPWLQRAKNRTDVGVVAAHSLAELYAVLTTLPVQPRIPPPVAQQLIKHNVLDLSASRFFLHPSIVFNRRSTSFRL